MRHSVDVPLEGSVDDVRANVDHVRHDWLVLSSVPRNVSRLPHSVPVGVLVVLMENGGLSGSPFSVGVWGWWVLGEDSAYIPVKEVRVVNQGFCVNTLIVHN